MNGTKDTRLNDIARWESAISSLGIVTSMSADCVSCAAGGTPVLQIEDDDVTAANFVKSLKETLFPQCGFMTYNGLTALVNWVVMRETDKLVATGVPVSAWSTSERDALLDAMEKCLTEDVSLTEYGFGDFVDIEGRRFCYNGVGAFQCGDVSLRAEAIEPLCEAGLIKVYRRARRPQATSHQEEAL